MKNDPIVEEIRKIRNDIAVESDFDMDKIYRRALEIQENWKGKLVQGPLKDRKSSLEKQPQT
ncbi:MAG: hypothetical protein ACLFTV_04510 [Desulfococcaceae bacterium]